MSSPFYQAYVEHYHAVRQALAEADVEVLRALELELASLPEDEGRAARVAIHDVYRRCPMRAERHLRADAPLY